MLWYIVHVFDTELGLLLDTSDIVMLFVTSQRDDLEEGPFLTTVPKRWRETI